MINVKNAHNLINDNLIKIQSQQSDNENNIDIPIYYYFCAICSITVFATSVFEYEGIYKRTEFTYS